MIEEAQKPRLSDLFRFSLRDDLRNSELLQDISLVGSGKGALALVLRYLQQQGKLENKLDEIMVPDWLGYWVYNQFNPFAFPAKRFSQRTRALFVYHQYGYPQDMDRILEFASENDLLVIEDCAHALNSFYKGKRLGWLGDFAIFSFSKWFFCFGLGGARGLPGDFTEFAGKEIDSSKFGLTAMKDAAKFFYEMRRGNFETGYSNLFLRMSYAVYQDALKPGLLARAALGEKLEKEIAIRQKRYQYFLQQTARFGICDHLETEGITPYAIPLVEKGDKMQILMEKLKKQGYQTGIYHFDINRNLLDPRFVPSLLVPVHSGIPDNRFDEIINTVIKNYA